jgi:hypothetical protein
MLFSYGYARQIINNRKNAANSNSRPEGFWLAKHKHNNIPTMMEPFPPPAAWF